MAQEPTPEGSPAVTPTSSQTPSIFNTASANTSVFVAGPKLSIKLDDKNFLIWNHQVEGVIATHKLHRLLVNPVIPQQFASTEDQRNGKVSEAYDRWFIQDQALYTWLLSTFSDEVLLCVLNCRHAHQVWDTIHKHYYAHLKAKTHQLRAELKTTKKGTRSISEYLARIRALANSLTAIGDIVSDQDLIDIVLDGLPEEYSSFVMIVFTKLDAIDLTDLESMLLVQEAQLDKFRQELASPAISANLVQMNSQHHSTSGTGRGSNNFGYPSSGYYRGRGRHSRGRGRGRTRNAPSNKPQCQVCSKFGHIALDC